MKILLTGLFLFSINLFAQQNPQLSVLDLEQKVRDSLERTKYENYSIISNNEKKSAGLAILYSLLLPGMGELYAGDYSSGKYFTIAEGALWTAYIGMNIYAGNKKDDYKVYAKVNASVNVEGKDDLFFATIGEYNSLEIYNDQKALERNFSEMYNSDSYFWKWNNSEERRIYRSMWSSSEQTYNDLRFVVGAMILNRVASAINAVRLVASHNKNISNEVAWNVSVGLSNPKNLPSSLNIYFQTIL